MDYTHTLVDHLVSIIMPAYNSESFIKESILSVQKQTYTNWELLIIDDCSTDRTVDTVHSFNDSRIKLIELEQNSGAAVARNAGIKQARGEFLAFLDSDDLWTEEKLEKQIEFMRENNYDFTCTEYAEMNEEGAIVNLIEVSDQLDYNGVLKYCPGNSTIIYNAKRLGKFYAPEIKRRNDFALWLKVIKKAGHVHGLHETYSIYRVRSQSLSSNKFKLISHQWNVLYNIEGLSWLKSAYILLHKIYTVITKHNKVEVVKNEKHSSH
ncbi:glycosyltransferase family 2 protein [Alkalibacterium sp. MB6]|uniref:glycosyltransferase family 2 protein n=1 Tax=Alkalibacterium sp. MB6 TaxID=2081965 RepID=UPI001F482A03|nr:glycosyltransferase family 2 protein [Alkalibacterium sp. MB6]